METKTHFQTDSKRIYRHPIECAPNPEEVGKWWVPFGAFPDAPPPTGPYEAARRTEDLLSWEVIPDFTGLEYYLPDRTRGVITEAGITPPAGYLTEDPGPTAAELLGDLKREATAGLDASDKVASRCVKFGVAYPQAWRNRDAELVAIVRLPAGTDPATVTFPQELAYPAGTEWPTLTDVSGAG